MNSILLGLFLLSTPVFLSAAPVIDGIRWQKSATEKAGPKIKFSDVTELRLNEQQPYRNKLRVVVNMRNNSVKAIDGIVMRCAFSMRLKKTGSSGEAVWGIPFWIDERRVSKVNTGPGQEVIVAHLDLGGYLSRLRGTGFWPDALKVQVMIEPREGDDLNQNITESVVNVLPG